MPIQVGDTLPQATFTRMTSDGPAPTTTAEVFEHKKVVLFAVPGAFTPVCHNQHLPSYLNAYAQFKAKGIDSLVCVAVNDVFVMDAWSKANHVGDRILMLADGNADFTRQIGMELDVTRFGMGVRSRRFSMVVDHGIVKELNLDAPGEVKASLAEATLCQL
jgi:glutaredoxin/glutathione-dependent peroxiredoxin